VPPAAEYAPAPASVLMESLAGRIGEGDLTVGAFLDQLDTRAKGLLLLLLALPMCVPNVPGVSTIFGVLLIAPALQMTFGQRTLWLPARVRAWTFQGRGMVAAIRFSVPVLRWCEKFTRPRMVWLTQWPMSGFVGLQTLVMALILVLPLWGANMPPGVAVSLTGLALLQRDGLLILLSTPIALGSVAWVYFGAKYAILLVQWLADLGAPLLGALF
jgi:hypothetical protein